MGFNTHTSSMTGGDTQADSEGRGALDVIAAAVADAHDNQHQDEGDQSLDQHSLATKHELTFGS